MLENSINVQGGPTTEELQERFFSRGPVFFYGDLFGSARAILTGIAYLDDSDHLWNLSGHLQAAGGGVLAQQPEGYRLKIRYNSGSQSGFILPDQQTLED